MGEEAVEKREETKKYTYPLVQVSFQHFILNCNNLILLSDLTI